ncbi:MAG: hypothetical protein ABR551_00225 [Gemmatimonadales bacterium]
MSAGSGSTGDAITRRETRLADLRRRGVRGGIIPRHRAMVGVAIPRRRMLTATTVALAIATAMFFALSPLAELWARLFEALVGPVGIAGGIGERHTTFFGVHSLPTPHFGAVAGDPSVTTWRVVAVITAVLVLLSLVLPQRFTPLRYFLRFLALLQTVSLAYFALAPAGSFPYTLASYTGGLLAAAQVVLVLLPLLLGFTYYVFDISWGRKLLLTALLLGHLALFIPLQVTIHAWLIVQGSLLVLPPLFLVFGLLLHVMIFVSFYGWGMSWPAARRTG